MFKAKKPINKKQPFKTTGAPLKDNRCAVVGKPKKKTTSKNEKLKK